MRIAILTNAFPPKTHGGAGRIAYVYSKLLEGQGHEVRVWGPDPKFYLLHEWPAPFRLFFHLRDLGPRKNIVKEIVGWKPDILLSHNLTGCGFGTPRKVKRSRRQIKWLHVLHDVQLFEPSGQIVYGETHAWLRRIWRRFWSRLRRNALGQPDIVVSPTQWLLDMHTKFGFFRTARKEILPNPVESSGVQADTQRDARRIVYVGRLDPDKGIDLLMAVWPRLREAASGLTLVGGGWRLEYLKSLQDEKLKVRGDLPHDQVLDLLRRCGVLLLPSLVLENQPTVILEALAMGCKVVAADVGGVRETLGAAGRTFRPGSQDALVAAVFDALRTQNDPERESARLEILKHHDPGVVSARLAGLLKSNL